MEADFQNRVLREIAEKGKPLDVTAGGVLRHDGSKIAAMYGGSARDLTPLQVAGRTLRTIFRARDAWLWKGMHDASMLSLGYARERMREPKDIDFLRDRDPAISRIVRDFLHRMMLLSSGFANEKSVGNFQKAMKLHRAGQSVLVEIVPHLSELEPVFLEIILDDVRRRTQDACLAADAKQFLDQNVTAIGHKVCLDPFRRMFSRAVRSTSVIAPKYRPRRTKEHGDIVKAHARVSSAITAHLQCDPRHLLVICPQGGRDENGNIGFHLDVPPEHVWHVPMMFTMPLNFMGIDAPETSRMPSQVQLYCGAPFQAAGSANSARLHAYIPGMRESLGHAEAPVGRFSWGQKKVNKNGPIDGARGVQEFFTEMIPKTSIVV